MSNRKTNYKTLGPECEVYVRQRTPNSSESRLIANYRRQSKPSAGFLVDLDYTFPLNTLVEMDVKFPGQSFYYRSRGIVEWLGKGSRPGHPHRLGIRVFGMEKLDPSGMQIAKPKRKTGLHPTARVSRKSTEAQLHEAAASSMETPAAARADAAQSVAAGAHAQTRGTGPQTDLKVPTASELAELLTSLIGETISVKPDTAEAMTSVEMAVVGDYKDESGTLMVVAATDIGLANWLGAALAMIPKEVARKDVDSDLLSEETKENTQEIFNINTSMLNGPGLPHLKFGSLFICRDNELPAAVQVLMDNPVKRLDVNVDVPGYGSGRMSYLFAEWHAPAAEMAGDAIGSAETQFQMPSPQIDVPAATGPPPEPVPVPGAASTGMSAAQEARHSAMKIVLPRSAEIAELLTNLVGEEVTVRPKDDAPMSQDAFVAIGDFLQDDGAPLGICVMDIALSNWSAAALAMIPKDVVRKDIENEALSEESRENVQEILNISASVFNKPTMPHLRFGALHVALDGPPPDPVKALMEAPEERVDFEVEIPGYGSGMLCCIFKTL